MQPQSHFINRTYLAIQLPENGAEAPKHVGEFVIKFNILIYTYEFVATNK
jgi:hypothetical protein